MTKKATTAAKGQYRRTCSRCGHSETKAIAKNNMTAKAKTKLLTAKAKRKTVIKKTKAFTITNAKGKVTFKKKKGNNKITVAGNGKITVRKGLKKGRTYILKVTVTSAATDKYKAVTKVITFRIKVK